MYEQCLMSPIRQSILVCANELRLYHSFIFNIIECSEAGFLPMTLFLQNQLFLENGLISCTEQEI